MNVCKRIFEEFSKNFEELLMSVFQVYHKTLKKLLQSICRIKKPIKFYCFSHSKNL